MRLQAAEVAESGNKAQAKEEKQEGRESRRNVGIGQQSCAYARQHNQPPVPTSLHPCQSKAQTEGK